MFYCTDCGQNLLSDLHDESKLVCKGCGKLGSEIREEVLSLSEKASGGDIGKVCPHCGAPIGEGFHFCHTCGKSVSD